MIVLVHWIHFLLSWQGQDEKQRVQSHPESRFLIVNITSYSKRFALVAMRLILGFSVVPFKSQLMTFASACLWYIGFCQYIAFLWYIAFCRLIWLVGQSPGAWDSKLRMNSNIGFQSPMLCVTVTVFMFITDTFSSLQSTDPPSSQDPSSSNG